MTAQPIYHGLYSPATCPTRFARFSPCSTNSAHGFRRFYLCFWPLCTGRERSGAAARTGKTSSPASWDSRGSLNIVVQRLRRLSRGSGLLPGAFLAVRLRSRRQQASHRRPRWCSGRALPQRAQKRMLLRRRWSSISFIWSATRSRVSTSASSSISQSKALAKEK